MAKADKVYYPPPGFYFSLSFEGIRTKSDFAFKEVSGIQMETEVEEIAEGGENRFKHRLPKASKYQDLELKRGLVAKGSSLAQWCKGTIGGGLNSPIQTKNVTVNLLDSDGNSLMAWSFANAWPVAWSVSNLNSMENQLMVETLKFAYSYFTVKS
ncbi:phage tail protein [bacterium SCSIO 12741]|nr:phage tail protein [bacterium SCSIO 12741]